MGIKVVWDNEEKTAIRYVYGGQWTWNDLFDAVEQANAMLDTVDHPAKLIIDLSKNASLPLDALRQGKRLIMIKHPNERMLVVAGANVTLQRLGNTFFRLNKRQANIHKIVFVSTLEEARTINIE